MDINRSIVMGVITQYIINETVGISTTTLVRCYAPYITLSSCTRAAYRRDHLSRTKDLPYL